jgi:hypothetical protein
MNPDLEANCHPITVALESCMDDLKIKRFKLSTSRGITRVENITSASATGKRMAAWGLLREVAC